MLRRIGGFVAALVVAMAVTSVVSGIAEAAKGNNRVTTNTAVSQNESSGTAQQITGSAQALGNNSTTSLSQLIGPASFGPEGFGNVALVHNNGYVTNKGTASAITGKNTGCGNCSTNLSGSFQVDSGGPFVVIPILGLGPGD